MIFDLPVCGHWLAQRWYSLVPDLIVFALLSVLLGVKRCDICKKDTSPPAESAP